MLILVIVAFSALTLMAGYQEEHPAHEWWGAGVVICLEQSAKLCIWSSWCHCHPIISYFIKIQNGSSFLVPAYPGCPRKEAKGFYGPKMYYCKFLFKDQMLFLSLNWVSKHWRGSTFHASVVKQWNKK